MTIETVGGEGAEVRAALVRSTEGIPAEIGVRVRLRARTYRVNGHRLPLVTGAALIVLVALVVSLVSVAGGASRHAKWELVSYVGTPAWQAEKGRNLHTASGLDCPTTSTCYAIVPGPIHGPTRIEYTHDGGTTWHESTLPANTTFTVETLGSDQLSCFGNKNCSTMGHNRGGLVFVTTHNGGRSWTLYREPQALYWNQPITAYACATATTCVALADAGKDFPPQDISPAQQKHYTDKDYSGVAFTTTTGWKRWSRHNVPGMFGASSVACVAPAHCVALGDVVKSNGSNEQLVSSDGGATWTQVSGPKGNNSQYLVCSAADCMSTQFIDPVFGSSTGLTVSTDYGRTWTRAAGRRFVSQAQNLACATGSDCWVSGTGLVYPAPGEETTKFELVSTSDQGQTWQEYTFALSTHIVSVGPISCPTASTCYAIAYKTGNAALPVLIRDNN